MLNKPYPYDTGRPPLTELLNPARVIRHLWQKRSLILLLSARRISENYKGTAFGFGWAIAEPLMMLCVYTFVFSVVFKGDWKMEGAGGITSTAAILFMGLITFGIFAEVASQAPTMVLQNPNFVKKVVFPLEILPVVSLISSLVTAMISFLVLSLGVLAVYHHLPLTVFLLPLAWVPMILFSLGCGFFLASLGVFIRDIGSAISIMVTMLRFLTPLFYPLTAVPESLQPIFKLNPISIYVETSRRVVLWGALPDWPWLLCAFVFSLMVMVCGFAWFMRTKHAFADVI